eukprot:CAMPEP_0168361104 /NCGR_PEP_ID=MMETSP0228-20121227/2498_1 /TAXON_ID=133427 /ORGANISM="Protoceratium reticulatum, Strain CCCM 535 (=CCMP 1889)" /LENGTH=123 /DNA_ID=CAMNT_0008373779 /DNA_START=301 /DNA_END=669 /DNA_ORIENTATION=+
MVLPDGLHHVLAAERVHQDTVLVTFDWQTLAEAKKCPVRCSVQGPANIAIEPTLACQQDNTAIFLDVELRPGCFEKVEMSHRVVGEGPLELIERHPLEQVRCHLAVIGHDDVQLIVLVDRGVH